MRINRDRLVENFRAFVAVADGECAAVVKADGYGLGLVEAASIFAGDGCVHFFVANAAEGVRLYKALSESPAELAPRLNTVGETRGPDEQRRPGLTPKPQGREWVPQEGHREPRIYVLEGALPDTAAALAAHRLIPVINHEEQLAWWEPHRALGIAVHVDTGMNRLGFAHPLAARSLDGYRPILLMTHLACADEPEHPLNEMQLRRFEPVAKLFPTVPTSIGNSAGALLGRRFQGDLARPGIGLYGGNPWSKRPNPMRPVATLEAPVLQIRTVLPGESVGYGATWRSERPGRLAVLGIGYADGLPRRLSNRGSALVRGRRCPIVGRVSMDLTTIDVTDCDARVGDWAELFGAWLPIDEVADTAETIAYELLTGIAPRVARIYETDSDASTGNAPTGNASTDN